MTTIIVLVGIVAPLLVVSFGGAQGETSKHNTVQPTRRGYSMQTTVSDASMQYGFNPQPTREDFLQ